MTESTNPPSYWDEEKPAAVSVADIALNGAGPGGEGVVRQAWESICLVYFNRTSRFAGGPMYRIARETFSELPPTEKKDLQPVVVAVRISNVRRTPNRPPTSSERDCLWIECRGPHLANPRGWNDVLREAVGRLQLVHDKRMVYVILAIGLKRMIFRWDPVSSPPTAPPLQITNNNDETGPWPVDPRIRPFMGEPYLDAAAQDGQCSVDTSRAHFLDYWTMEPSSTVPANWPSMQLLEQHFATIRDTAFMGFNPA